VRGGEERRRRREEEGRRGERKRRRQILSCSFSPIFIALMIPSLPCSIPFLILLFFISFDSSLFSRSLITPLSRSP
jgi:hypothetical protein